MQNILKTIKNIIFDLGGVIINLDYEATVYEFNKLSAIPFEDIYSQKSQVELFNLFDKGQISDYDFFNEIRKLIRYQGPDEDLLSAWNAMLLGVPDNRLDVLIETKQYYRTFLLSNTNESHITAFERDLYHTNGVKNFNDYFDEVYYSCRMGMRKPDKEIFEHVLLKNELVPSETIFIDDSAQHVKGAGDCGINGYLLRPEMEIGELLKDLKLL